MATAKDVAALAGVSTATVSYVLNGNAKVSPETRNKVLQVVRELGYKPNFVARNLRVKRTNIVGLIVTNLDDPMYAQLARSAEDAAARRGLTLMLANSSNDPAMERRHIELLRAQQVDGIVLAPCVSDYAHLDSLVEEAYPVVALGRSVPGQEIPAVTADNEAAAFLATSHLIEHGYESVGVLLPLSGTELSLSRLEGHKRALAEAGLPFISEHCLDGESSLKGGVAAAQKMLASPNRPRAIVAHSSLMAIAVLQVMQEMGLRAPEDVAIIGFGEFPWSRITQPPLTTIAQPTQSLGATAVNLVADLASGAKSVEPVQLPCRMILRQSCGCHVSYRTTSQSAATDETSVKGTQRKPKAAK